MATPAFQHATQLRAGYTDLILDKPLPDDTLLAVGFGAAAPLPADPRCLRVGLEPLAGTGCLELWRGPEPARRGHDGEVRYAASGGWLMAALEVDERQHGGIAAATRHAYREFVRFNAASGHPQVLRVWNYLDAINAGQGDDERYRQFCVGRAEGLGPATAPPYPAATAIGRRDRAPVLQMYWLAATGPGHAIENPRQLSAFRYPREYGPEAPRFSRAMRSGSLLLVSGTASIVGHASMHAGSVAEQLAETCANLESVVLRAHEQAPGVPAAPGQGSLLKLYLRDADQAGAMLAGLRARFAASVPVVVLAADICRADLQLEIDCTVQP